jgi:hypothetical protein
MTRRATIGDASLRVGCGQKCARTLPYLQPEPEKNLQKQHICGNIYDGAIMVNVHARARACTRLVPYGTVAADRHGASLLLELVLYGPAGAG